MVAAAERDAEGVRRLLAAVAADTGLAAGAGVQSAEQVYWAAQTLAADLVRRDPKLARGDLPRQLERLYRQLQDREAFDRDLFAATLASVARAAGR